MATNAGPSPPDAFKSVAEPGSLSSLLQALLSDVTALFRSELRLAKAEASEAISAMKAGAVGMAVAVAVVFAGALALLAAAVLALAEVLEPWLAALIVGVAVTLIGFGLLQAAKKKLNPLSLDRTQESLRKDAALVGGERR
jgi:xanthine/uracil permease